MMTLSRTTYSSLPKREREKFKVIQFAEYAKKVFKGCQSEEGLVIDATDRRVCRYWAENPEGDKRRIFNGYPYGSKYNTMVIKGLIILGENGCFEKPMNKDKFKDMLVEGEPNIDRSDVNEWFKRNTANNLFEINGGIKPRYPVKEVVKSF